MRRCRAHRLLTAQGMERQREEVKRLKKPFHVEIMWIIFVKAVFPCLFLFFKIELYFGTNATT